MMGAFLSVLLVAGVAVALNYGLKVLARLQRFRWLESGGSSLRIMNPFPTPYRYVFVYLGTLITFILAHICFR